MYLLCSFFLTLFILRIYSGNSNADLFPLVLIIQNLYFSTKMVFKNTNLYYRHFVFPGDNTNLYFRVNINTNLYFLVDINTKLYSRVIDNSNFVLSGLIKIQNLYHRVLKKQRVIFGLMIVSFSLLVLFSKIEQ